ncbi:hypothetical protein BDQ12DRAFT_245728 [Crucibulum laeve]|uniref:Uncharacterized protein n=1 Tax=Crucibulum laeve TaxID=68775 RepID=A0A5C3LUU7_9AGAR|nr:hypothetical protein BDQ12DRAFT_245728 [Crucibulum laeve]
MDVSIPDVEKTAAEEILAAESSRAHTPAGRASAHADVTPFIVANPAREPLSTLLYYEEYAPRSPGATEEPPTAGGSRASPVSRVSMEVDAPTEAMQLQRRQPLSTLLYSEENAPKAGGAEEDMEEGRKTDDEGEVEDGRLELMDAIPPLGGGEISQTFGILSSETHPKPLDANAIEEVLYAWPSADHSLDYYSENSFIGGVAPPTASHPKQRAEEQASSKHSTVHHPSSPDDTSILAGLDLSPQKLRAFPTLLESEQPIASSSRRSMEQRVSSTPNTSLLGALDLSPGRVRDTPSLNQSQAPVASSSRSTLEQRVVSLPDASVMSAMDVTRKRPRVSSILNGSIASGVSCSFHIGTDFTNLASFPVLVGPYRPIFPLPR